MSQPFFIMSDGQPVPSAGLPMTVYNLFHETSDVPDLIVYGHSRHQPEGPLLETVQDEAYALEFHSEQPGLAHRIGRLVGISQRMVQPRPRDLARRIQELGLRRALIFGQNSGQIQVRGVKTWDMGVINDDRLIAAAYSASNVFVSTSLADNLPNTIMESLACGTPVAAFDAGGVGDMVRHMETGYLARSHDIADLAQGLSQLLSNSELCQRLSARAREVAVGEYSQDLQATRYMGLYEELVREPSSRHASNPSLAREPASSI